MVPSLTSTRKVQIAFLVLLLICAAQIAFWMIDEKSYIDRVESWKIRSFEQDVLNARRMIEAGLDRERIREWFPHLQIPDEGAGVVVDVEILGALNEASSRRITRFVSEGAFFFVILIAGMVILTRSLWQQAHLHQREQNFIASVTHELKSPLASIRLACETMQMRETLGERGERLMGRIVSDVHRLEGLILNILETRRLDDGATAREQEAIEIDQCLQRLVGEIRPRLLDRGRTIVEDYEPGLWMRGDPAGVDAVLRNLLDNAEKATAETKAGQILVTARSEPDTVVVDVSDNGFGFEPGESERLFEKFYRAGDEMRRTTQGTGLGLYLVQQFVNRDGGTIEAFSNGPNQGARFVVRWPALARPA